MNLLNTFYILNYIYILLSNTRLKGIDVENTSVLTISILDSWHCVENTVE